jgi:hypothetical protein
MMMSSDRYTICTRKNIDFILRDGMHNVKTMLLLQQIICMSLGTNTK